MDARRRRISQWVIWLVIAALFCGISRVIEYHKSLPEKQPLTVYAPSDMEDAFKFALKRSALSESHYIVMSDDPNSNICVECDKQGDVSYENIAYSPFVVAYDNDSSFYKKLKKAKVCFESAYDSTHYEIDFLKIIDEAIGEGKWENLGIIKQGDLKVFYPDETSTYWSDFHNFLLVTVNDGRYPENEAEFEKAEEIILKFLDSKYTEGVTNFYEQAKRTNGFPSTVMYILPEIEARKVCRSNSTSMSAWFFYPIKTVYVNYYAKGDDLGIQIIDAFDKTNIWGTNFYSKLCIEHYRSKQCTELNGLNNVTGDGNIYNVTDIPENKEFSTTSTSE